MKNLTVLTLLALLSGAVYAKPALTYYQETDRLIVKYKDGRAKIASASMAPSSQSAALGALIKKEVVAEKSTALGASVFKLSKSVSLSEARILAERAKEDPNVEYAVPDVRVRPFQAAPNDTGYQFQWSIKDRTSARPGATNAIKVWQFTRGLGVTVAVVDTGKALHPDLAGQELPGYDFVSADSGNKFDTAGDGDGRDMDETDPGDFCQDTGDSSSWHGLKVAGIIGAVANNSYGVAGMAPDVKLTHMRVLGRCGGYISDTVDGALWAAGLPVTGAPTNPHPAKIINMSLGAAAGVGCSVFEQTAFNKIKEAGATVIVASGNDGANALGTPATCQNVIVVGAHTLSADMASYSNYAAGVTLTAPGGGPCRTQSASVCGTPAPTATLGNDGSFSAGKPMEVDGFIGTSAATPHVAAAAALLLALKPTLTPDELKFLLTSTAAKHAEDSFCARTPNACGAGMLDVEAAVAAVEAIKIALTPSSTKLKGNEAASATAKVSGGTGQLTYQWTQTGGSPVTLDGASTLTVKFNAPAKRTDVTLELKVTSSSGTSAKSQVTFAVNNAPLMGMPPLVETLVDQPISIDLKASDFDEDAITFKLIDAPSGFSIADGKLIGIAQKELKAITIKVQALDAFGGVSETQVFNVSIVKALTLVREEPKSGGGTMSWWSLVLLALAAGITRRKTS